jgi:hypothetical protein
MNTRIPICANFRHRSDQRGSAVLIFLILLSVMLVLVAANGRTLNSLKREIRLIEQSQVRRLERSQTGAASPALFEAKPAPAAP